MPSTSAALERRTSLLQNHNVPGQHEIRENLGSPLLSQAVLHTMSPVAKELMCISKKFSTPPTIMWVNPTDTLEFINTNGARPVTITEPPRQIANIKAFTHSALMDIGNAIEAKVQHNNSIRIRRAVDSNERFERFECKNRIEFAVQQAEVRQRLQQTLKQEQMLQAFQEEREQLMEAHKENLRSMKAAMEEKYSNMANEKVAEASAEFERETLKLELCWRIEEQTYKAAMLEMERNAIAEVQNERNKHLRLIQEIYAEYRHKLLEQRNEIQCQHMGEIMHIICAEKSEAHDIQERMKKAHKKIVKKIQQQHVDEIEAEKANAVLPKKCPNAQILRRELTNMLRKFEEYIEWSMKGTPGHGKFLLPIQKLLEKICRKDFHPSGESFDCNHDGGGNPYADLKLEERSVESQERIISKNNQPQEAICPNFVFLPHENKTDCYCPEPILIGMCEVDSVISIESELPTPKSCETTSLASIEYDDKKYFSLKRLQELEALNAEVEWVAGKAECDELEAGDEPEMEAEASPNSFNSQKYDVEQFVSMQANLFTRITNTASSTCIMSDDQVQDFKREILEFIQMISGAMMATTMGDNIGNGLSFATTSTAISSSPAIVRDRASKLLSTIDSFDLLHVPKDEETDAPPRKYQYRMVNRPSGNLNVSMSEYADTFVEAPKYLYARHDRDLLWKYEPVTSIEWLDITKQSATIPPVVTLDKESGPSRERYLSEIDPAPILKKVQSGDLPTLRTVLDMLEKGEDIAKFYSDQKSNNII